MIGASRNGEDGVGVEGVGVEGVGSVEDGTDAAVGDRWIVATAVATVVGAWIGMRRAEILQFPFGLALGSTGAALALRRPWLVCVAVGLLAMVLAQRSLAGLGVVPPTGPVQAEVTLLTDPAATPGGSVRAEVRLGGRHLALSAHRSAAAALDDRLAGERIMLNGEVRPPGPYERRMAHRHLVGRLEVDTVMGWRSGHGVTRVANGLRRTLVQGAGSLSDRQRSLFTGLVLGDDRGQPADLTDAFRTAGLGHLTAVSGQNVSFLLAVAAPLLMRVRFAPRLVLTLVVLAGFALITRGEPSVLRATAMATVGAFGSAVGRPSSSLRALSLAVVGLLLVDPLLVSSLGFQLSVVGAAGIIVGAAPIQRGLPGPRWVTTPLAVTCAAQLAVAPLLVAAFGSVSLASLPANLLAAPAAGPVMMWGLTGGLVAGVVGEPLATLLHAPTRLLLAWIEAVALAGARWPLGELRMAQLLLILCALVVVVGVRPASVQWRGLARGLRVTGAALGVLALVSAAWVPAQIGTAAAPAGPTAVGAGMTLWRGGGAVLVEIDGRASESDLSAGLRQAGVGRVDILVVRTVAERAVSVAARARQRWPTVVVLAPAGVVDQIAGATTPPLGSTMDIGGLRVRFNATEDRLTPSVLVPP